MDKTTGALCSLAFSVGAIAGAYAAYKKLDARYQTRLEDDLNEAREERREFLRSRKTAKEEKEEDVPEKDDKDIGNLSKKISELGYDTQKDTPYVISPDDFGEFEDYEMITLTYFSDGVLTDDNKQRLDDAEDIVGKDFAEHFGEYEDDAVYIRNDERKCDYEIIRDLDSYSELLRERPHLGD